MIEYSAKPLGSIRAEDREIFFFDSGDNNIDHSTVNAFGEEWNKFNSFSEEEIQAVGREYFDIVSEKQLNKDSLVLDVGCGSGRWTRYISDKAKFVEAIDPSNAVMAAAKLLRGIDNVRITKASAEHIPFADNTFDFVFSLGVLHHIPDTQAAMKVCVSKLKQDGFFLVYLYYNFDNRGIIFKTTFYLSDVSRKIISRLPVALKKIVCDLIAVFIYLPLLAVGDFFEAIKLQSVAKKIPLDYYRDKTFRIIRNDALDRFGTPLEQRFSKQEVKAMMENSGLTDIVFSESTPYWHAIGRKK